MAPLSRREFLRLTTLSTVATVLSACNTHVPATASIETRTRIPATPSTETRIPIPATTPAETRTPVPTSTPSETRNVTSKLSVHISSGNRRGFTDWLQKCSNAGSPIRIIYSLNEDISGDIARYSPSTRWVYRRQSEAWNRLPDGLYLDDPEKSATRWLSAPLEKGKSLMDIWRLNSADWFDPLNEPVIELADPNNPAQVADTVRRAQWLNTWMITALNTANSNGFKLALFSFPTGSPPLLKWNEVNTSQIQVPANPDCQSIVWYYLLPALRLGKQLGAILSLHAYWEDRDPSTDHSAALRYRDVVSILPLDAQLPIVISEASSGNGYGTLLSGQRWIDDMAKYDSQLMKDDYVLGACAFQLGGSESNLVSALPQYAEYIATH